MDVCANNYSSKYFLREITETKDLIDPQIFYMYERISNIHCH